MLNRSLNLAACFGCALRKGFNCLDTFSESSVTESSYDETPIPLEYDSGSEYDVGFTFYSGFTLVITDVPGTGTKSPTQSWLDDYLKPAIQNFIAPIWATLGAITYTP